MQHSSVWPPGVILPVNTSSEWRVSFYFFRLWNSNSRSTWLHEECLHAQRFEQIRWLNIIPTGTPASRSQTSFLVHRFQSLSNLKMVLIRYLKNAWDALLYSCRESTLTLTSSLLKPAVMVYPFEIMVKMNATEEQVKYTWGESSDIVMETWV